mgnify:CR=1 FL=1
MPFLIDHDPRPLALSTPVGVRPVDLFVGSGGMALEVAVLEADQEPTATQLRELHRERLGRRAAPVVIVVLWGRDRAAICGGPPESLSIHTDLDRGQVERLCSAALKAADRHAAIRYLAQALPQLASPIPGLRNEGLFALHELMTGVPRRTDWPEAVRRARPILSARGRTLVERLGFQAQPLPGPAALLIAGGKKAAIAVFLERPDEIEPPGPLFDGLSPVSYALAKADHERLDYVIVSAGPALRIYPVKPGVGTGRRGRTETYLELNLDLLREDDAGYLWLLFSADALVDGGSFTQVLATSEEYAADLSSRLRERVYQDVVPQLARAIAKARGLRKPTADQLAETYDMALLVLFRLLFIAYAEDKELLPLHTSDAYREHSLKHMAQRLLDDRRREVAWGDEDFYWTEVRQLWKAVDKGNPGWSVPPYNGGLFTEDGDESAAKVAVISLPDTDFAPALSALLLDETPEGDVGPIDFRSLGVREFGTIYEGLLESELSVAETDLAVQPKTGAYVPATGNAEVVVRAGEVYLHNASGARKSSGAYYTKSFAVEHLLDAALEPALDDHFARLDALDDRTAAARFFDFRVADVAMGSGHFLVAAVDRIERRFSNYLAKRPLADVTNELERLRKSALRQLGEDWAGEPLEDTQLLRRQIARRCIYGVDVNPLAVELARLSIWIHTFVPGLPLSFLDQNLVVGNSLVGIATFDEANEILAGSGDLFSITAADRLARAREPLEKLAKLADATAAEVAEAKELYRELKERTRSEAGLLTILAASRIDEEIHQAVDQGQIATLLQGEGDVFTDTLLRRAEEVLSDLNPLHFPIAFPQVFLGERAGFDVILGNPPWDKVRFEEDAFYVRYIPGLMSLLQGDRKKAIASLQRSQPALVERHQRAKEHSRLLQKAFRKQRGGYVLQGSGHLDLAKLFTERIIHLIAKHGRIGIVLPRQCLVLSGWSELRRALFSASETLVCQLRNRGGWIFDDAPHRYVIALIATWRRGNYPDSHGTLVIAPGADTAEAWAAALKSTPLQWSTDWIEQQISPNIQVPLFTIPGEERLFSRLLGNPQLGSEAAEKFRGHPFAVVDVGKDVGAIGQDSGSDGVFLLRTRNISAFVTTRDGNGRLLSSSGLQRFLERKIRGAAWASELDGPMGSLDVLGLLSLVYRYPSRNDDARTLIATYLPPGFCPAVGYVHSLVMPRANLEQRLAVLGMLNSIVWDWVARRIVDRHVTSSVIRLLPLPRNPMQWQYKGLASIAARLLEIRTGEGIFAFQDWGISPASYDEFECQIELNRLVFEALEITPTEVRLMLEDFSDRGVEPALRNRLERFG